MLSFIHENIVFIIRHTSNIFKHTAHEGMWVRRAADERAREMEMHCCTYMHVIYMCYSCYLFTEFVLNSLQFVILRFLKNLIFVSNMGNDRTTHTHTHACLLAKKSTWQKIASNYYLSACIHEQQRGWDSNVPMLAQMYVNFIIFLVFVHRVAHKCKQNKCEQERHSSNNKNAERKKNYSQI